MGLFSKIKSALTNSTEISSNSNAIFQEKTDKQADIKYPQLYNQCKNIYNMIINYECQLSGKDGIELYEKLYEDTKDEEYLKMLEEAKHKLFIKPQVIKDLISTGRDVCGLSKEFFYDEIKTYFVLIATNKEFTPAFCFEYLNKEIEEHYFYNPIKHVDFNNVINECFINKNSEKIKKAAEYSKENKCPYCDEIQESELVRNKKCCNCGKKIYVLKILDKKLYLNEKDYQFFKEEQENNKSKLDFCYMILQCGVSEEELETYLNNGNINRVNDLAWRKLSEYRNRYFEKGQIDMLSKVNLNMAKILIYEGKYKTAIHFICESLYEDGSPISFHPGHPYKEVNGKIQNIYKDDTNIFNERHKAYINEYSLKLLSSLKNNFNEVEFQEEIRTAFEESSHFYLEKSPHAMFEEVINALNL